MKITRDLFIETIEELQRQYEHDKKCHEAFKVILPNDYVSSYDNHLLTNQLVKLLQIEFNDNHKDSWIEYFLWQLDFGKKQSIDFCARFKNGKMIDLANAGKLYDFLITNPTK